MGELQVFGAKARIEARMAQTTPVGYDLDQLFMRAALQEAEAAGELGEFRSVR